MSTMKPITTVTSTIRPIYKLPPLPASHWDGDSRYTWTGKPFEYTTDDMREYGRKCFEAGVELGKLQNKSKRK